MEINMMDTTVRRATAAMYMETLSGAEAATTMFGFLVLVGFSGSFRFSVPFGFLVPLGFSVPSGFSVQTILGLVVVCGVFAGEMVSVVVSCTLSVVQGEMSW